MTQTKISYVTSPRAVQVVDAPVGIIRGYVALWGDSKQRDSYNTYFDPARPPHMGIGTGMEKRPILYEHGFDKRIKADILGQIDRLYFDDQGIGFEAHLDRSSPHFNQIVRELELGKLKTSSATMEHTAEFYDDGAFRTWILGELSLTSDPAESRMPAVQIIRSQTPGTDGMSEADGDGDATQAAAQTTTQQHVPEEVRDMTLQDMLKPEMAGQVNVNDFVGALVNEFGLEEVQAVLAQMQAPAADAAATPVALSSFFGDIMNSLNARRSAAQQNTQLATLQQQMQVMRTQLQQQQDAPPVQEAARISPTRNVRVEVDEPRYYGDMTASEMALGYMILRSNARQLGDGQHPVSDEYMRAMVDRTLRLQETGSPAANDPVVRSNFRMKDGRAIRANEIMQATTSGFGSEWVDDLQGTELWETIRHETPLYDRMIQKGMVEKELPRGFNAESIPIEGADPVWYVAGGAANMDANSGMPTPTFNTSKIGTGETSVSVAKLSVAIPFNKELEEDSIIDLAKELRRKIDETGKEQIEYILLNGDTATAANTNINLIDGTPPSAPSKPSYMLVNGLMRLPLVTNTSNARDVGALFNEVDFLAALGMLPPAFRTDRARLLFVFDADTALTAANIPAFKTQDVYSKATLEEGELIRAYKVDILQSAQMGPALNTGKISATAASNVFGRLLLVRPDRWTTRWKRRMDINIQYYGYADASLITGHMRWGLAYRDNEAASVVYGIPLTLE